MAKKYLATQGAIIKKGSNQTPKDTSKLDTVSNNTPFIQKLPERYQEKIFVTGRHSINHHIVFHQMANSLL